MLVRKSLFDKLGGFDSRLPLGYEDAKICWRAWIQRWKTIYVSSAKCWHRIGTICSYPKFTPVPFREESFWEGYPEETNAPYGLAKKMMLVQLQAYREQNGLNGIYLTPANLSGPRDNFDLETSHVIPALIRKFLDARESGGSCSDVWGTGSATREFLFAEGAAEGIIVAAERYSKPDLANLGSDSEISVPALVEKICDITGFQGPIQWDHSKPDGQPRRSLGTSRALAEFGWCSPTNLDQGLQETVEWFRQHRSTL